MDIEIQQKADMTLLASCARDRTVQVFKKGKDSWALAQTLDDHIGSVSGVMFIDDKLISWSSDRTIVIREIVSKNTPGGGMVVACLPIRTLTLKATPIDITSDPDQADTLLVSTIDRHIQKFDIPSGRMVQTFRTSDPESNDAVVMDALVMGKDLSMSTKSRVVAGVSTTDKSIRLYDSIAGNLIAREWGHTEGVSDVALLQIEADSTVDGHKTTLVSTGFDGTIMIWDWDFREKSQQVEISEALEVLAADSTPSKEITAARQPLRRVLSRSELAEFQRPPTSEQDVTPVSTPTGSRSPPRTVRRRRSEYSLARSPKLGLPPMPPLPLSLNASVSPTPSHPETSARKGQQRDRSPSPPSPKNGTAPRRPSLDARQRTKSSGNVSEFGSLNSAAEGVCRTLRAFRKKMNTSGDSLKSDNIRELERELGLTQRSVGEKVARGKENDGAVARLLDQYSERLLGMIDEKITGRDGGTELGSPIVLDAEMVGEG